MNYARFTQAMIMLEKLPYLKGNKISILLVLIGFLFDTFSFHIISIASKFNQTLNHLGGEHDGL